MIEVKFSPAQLRSIDRMVSKLGDAKTANALVSKAARIAARKHLLPQSKQATPRQTGALRKNTKIRAMKRSRVGAGVRVGYSDKDFAGEGFYGSFVEYGYRVGPRKLGETRTKVEGQKNLKKVAAQNGPKAVDEATKLIARSMEQIAKR